MLKITYVIMSVIPITLVFLLAIYLMGYLNDKHIDKPLNYTSCSVENDAASKSNSPDNYSDKNVQNNNSNVTKDIDGFAGNDTYVNAYGHKIKKGQQDNTGIAQRDRERNVDIKNVQYLIDSQVSVQQKINQLNAWSLHLTNGVGPGSYISTIWARDKKTAIGTINMETGEINMH